MHADALDQQRRPLLQDVLLRHPLPLRAARDGGAVLAVRRNRWPLPGDGVPGRHLLLRVGDVPAHEAVRVGAVPAGPRRDPGRRPAGAARHGHRDQHLLPGQRRPAPGVRAPGDVLHGRCTPATAVGRDRVRRLTRPAAERPGQLGHAGGGVRGRCVLGLGAWPTGPDRDLPGCRHGDEALPVVPGRRDARRVRAPRAGVGVRQGVGGRRRGLGGAQPAGDAHRLRAVEGVLVVQRRAGARPGVAVADGQQPSPHGLTGHGEPGVLAGVRGRVHRGPGARAARGAPTADGPARVPGRRGVPDREQGLLAAVRALAAAAGRAGAATTA